MSNTALHGGHHGALDSTLRHLHDGGGTLQHHLDDARQFLAKPRAVKQGKSDLRLLRRSHLLPWPLRECRLGRLHAARARSAHQLRSSDDHRAACPDSNGRHSHGRRMAPPAVPPRTHDLALELGFYFAKTNPFY